MPPSPVHQSRLLDYLRLFRAPNVFTALSDVMCGFLIVQRSLEPLWQFALLASVSTLLYTAGMVLNDVFDVEIDRHERPQRPLPSGRISLDWARWLGFEMLVLGVICGWLAGFAVRHPPDLPWRPGVIATTLGACVLLYDAWAKKTMIGPWIMGGCRSLNLLLGMSIASPTENSVSSIGAYTPWQLAIAGGMGLYITGVTWFARSEAKDSPRFPLVFGMIWMITGLVLLACFPRFPEGQLAVRIEGNSTWPLAVCLLSVPILRRCALALWEPTPGRVQAAVKNGILSLIILNAATCFAIVDWQWAVVVVSLLLPALILGRWVYST